MRTVAVVLLSAALGVSSAFLVACGDRNSLIPKDDAAALVSDLDRASSLYAGEECRAAQRAVLSARERAGELPPEVDTRLRATLQDNVDAVLARIREQCGRTQTTQTTQTTTTATQPTETTETATTTEPPPTTTTTEPPPTTTTETEPSDDDDGGGGSGGTPPAQAIPGGPE